MAFGTPLERFEYKFLPLSRMARELARILWQLMNDQAPHGVPGDQFPDATVLRLNSAAMVQYHAAVAGLAEAETALGSLALLRSLIEAWAHLFFIWGQGDKSGGACRALRLERGLAAQAVGLAMAAGPTEPGMLEKAKERQQILETLSVGLGCKGGKRDYGAVDQTVKDMAAGTSRLDWLVGLWRSASQAAHNAGWDWLFQDQGDGTNALVYPPPSHRATRLNHLAILYNNVGGVQSPV